MQIIFVRARHLLPAASAKIRAVIARWIAVFAFSEIKVISILSVRILKCLLKPLVLIRAVIYYQIHDDMHITLLCLGKELIKLLHSAELFCYCIVISYVIALIHKWRFIYRRQPYLDKSDMPPCHATIFSP